jgi:hypothetical protein
MYIIRVFQKIVFICNLCFLAAWWMRTLRSLDHLGAEVFIKTIVVLGFVAALPMNVLLNVVIAFLFLIKKITRQQVQMPLLLINIVFLFLTFFYFLLT